MIVNESKKNLKKKFTIFNHPFNNIPQMYGHLLCGQGFLQCRVLPTEKLVSEIPLHAFDIPNNFETTIDIIDEKIVELKNYKKEFTDIMGQYNKLRDQRTEMTRITNGEAIQGNLMKYLDKATFQKISETKATLLKFASVVTTLSTENDFGVGALLLIATRLRESFAKAMERGSNFA